jgi:hypothetical protein
MRFERIIKSIQNIILKLAIVCNGYHVIIVRMYIVYMFDLFYLTNSVYCDTYAIPFANVLFSKTLFN